MVDDMPPGFRFFPTEQELVSFYLYNKLEGKRDDLNRLMDRVIPVVNIYDHNPWDLPQFSEYLCHRDPEQWFFFTPRQESESRGGRPKRLTTIVYWKATGSPGYVYSSNRAVGEKRTMVFYIGRAPSGRKTEWKMNEYKLAIEGEASTSNAAINPGQMQLRQEFSLCRVYKKSKCLCAFDRRPLPGVVISEPMAQVQVEEASAPPQLMAKTERITSSPERSSSADHHGGHDSQNMAIAMVSNGEPSWDWDQLDWFCEMR